MKNFLGYFIYFIIFGSSVVMAIEEAAYTSILNDEIFEIREYESHVLAEIEIDGSFEEAGGKAFSKLFRYISGENIPQKKIKMTAPVSQSYKGENINMTSPVSQEEKNGKWLVSFMMPSSYSFEQLHQPKDSDIQLRQVPGSFIASVRYSGFWSKKKYRDYLDLLNKWISGRQLKAIGTPIWARYDAPYVPWFLRRNEILIPINQP